ncbi:MAG: hypothetical protein J5871_04505, partial [Bacteroidales bacterium]|nr:hypothetical protein [Bacteroidales bacterium]
VSAEGASEPVLQEFAVLHEPYLYKNVTYQDTWDLGCMKQYRMVGFSCRVPAKGKARLTTQLRLVH